MIDINWSSPYNQLALIGFILLIMSLKLNKKYYAKQKSSDANYVEKEQ